MPLPRGIRHAGLAITAGLAVAIAAASSALPAQAASQSGWRPVFRDNCPKECFYGSVATSGRSSGWAVGEAGANGNIGSGRPIAARWRAGGWHLSPMPAGLAGGLNAVSVDSPTDAWAVSGQNGYLLHWNGTRWYVARRWPENKGLPLQLTGVTAFSRTNVWVFGGPGAGPGLGTWHYNGRTWQHVTAGPGAGVVTASALAPADMWAIGSSTSPQDSIVRYTGAWHQISAPALAKLQFNGIDALAAGNVWASATLQVNYKKDYLVHLVNGRWSRIAVPYRVVVGRIAADGHGGVWIAAQAFTGGTSWLLHRTGTGRWSRVSLGSNALPAGITRVPGTAALWAAGMSGGKATIWGLGRVG